MDGVVESPLVNSVTLYLISIVGVGVWYDIWYNKSNLVYSFLVGTPLLISSVTLILQLQPDVYSDYDNRY